MVFAFRASEESDFSLASCWSKYAACGSRICFSYYSTDELVLDAVATRHLLRSRGLFERPTEPTATRPSAIPPAFDWITSVHIIGPDASAFSTLCNSSNHLTRFTHHLSGKSSDGSFHISPHCATTTSWFGFSRVVRTFSILRTTSRPSTTCPKTTCLPFKKGVGAHVMKNWQPFVFGPEF